MTPIYYVKKGYLSFADKVILANLEFYLYPGEKICLIGKNGCGKSSLMKVICGDYQLDNSELFKNPKTTIGYLTQDAKTAIDSTIYDFIINQSTSSLSQQYQADIILEKLQLDGNLILSKCSGGQARRAYLAKVLIVEPDILLLDEPTNHLDIATIEWLEDYVKSYKGTVICISHDRTFLSNVTNRIWWLDRGILRKSEQGFKYFDQWQELIMSQEEASFKKLNKKLDHENDWLSAGVTGRRKRNQKRLADLHLLRASSKQQSLKLGAAKQNIQAAFLVDVRKTKFIIEADNLSFAYNERKIIDNFSFRVKKGEKIGIIGANGSGKTTLVKLLTKEIMPQQGAVTHGTELQISYLDQHRFQLNPADTLQQTLCPNGGDYLFLDDQTIHVASYLKKFMFDPQLLKAKVSTLSGGEANRLLLAKILVNPGNLLILDEPTNDLDLDSLEVLLEILADFKGTLIIVSHDRDFLDRLVTRSLVFDQAQVTDFMGGYQDYQTFIAQKTTKTISKAANKTGLAASSKDRQLLAAKPVKASAVKLSYKHQRLLETIPLDIEALSLQTAQFEQILSDRQLYLSDPNKFRQTSCLLHEYKQRIEDLITQWVSIEEMLR